MRTNLVMLGIASLVAVGAVGAAGAATPAADATFMKSAAADGKAEVELGQLASDKATRAEVKDFGKMMVEDHSKAGSELAGLAAQKAVTLPADVKPEHKALQARLSKLSGTAFDTAYANAMVTAHEKAVALFKKEATTGGDADAKAWAAKTLPTLETHLAKARALAGPPKH